MARPVVVNRDPLAEEPISIPRDAPSETDGGASLGDHDQPQLAEEPVGEPPGIDAATEGPERGASGDRETHLPDLQPTLPPARTPSPAATGASRDQPGGAPLAAAPAHQATRPLTRIARVVTDSKPALVLATVVAAALASFAAGHVGLWIAGQVFATSELLIPGLLRVVDTSFPALAVASVVIVSRRNAWTSVPKILASTFVLAVVLAELWSLVHANTKFTFVVHEAVFWAIVAGCAVLSTGSRVVVAQAVGGAAIAGALIGVMRLEVAVDAASNTVSALWFPTLPAVIVALVLGVVLARAPVRAHADDRD